MGGQSVAFEFRTQDARIARFLSTDPLTAKTPWETPYAFAGNGPIANIDYLGLERVPAAGGGSGGGGGIQLSYTDGSAINAAVAANNAAKLKPATTEAMTKVIQDAKEAVDPIKRRILNAKNRAKRRRVNAANRNARRQLRGRGPVPSGRGGNRRILVGPNGGAIIQNVRYGKISGGTKKAFNYNKSSKRRPPGSYNNPNSWFTPKDLGIKQALERTITNSQRVWVWDTRFGSIGTAGIQAVNGVLVPTVTYTIPVQTPVNATALSQVWFPAGGTTGGTQYQIFVTRGGVNLGNVLNPANAAAIGGYQGGDVMTVVPVVSASDLRRLAAGRRVPFQRRISQPFFRVVARRQRSRTIRIRG